MYVYEPIVKKDGTKGIKQKIKITRSGNPFTHSLDYIAKKLIEAKEMDNIVWKNIEALLEIRDNAIHFYNHENSFSIRLQEIGAASLRNFVTIAHDWFRKDLSKYNFYLMPLAFLSPPQDNRVIILNKEEKNFLNFIKSLEKLEAGKDNKFSVSINVEIKYTRSKAVDALNYRLTNNQNATPLRLTEEQILDKYPLNYEKLTKECKSRYVNFSINKNYHELRKSLKKDSRYAKERKLYPDNPRSAKTWYFNHTIFEILDKYYKK